jgi:hypothetical protein
MTPSIISRQRLWLMHLSMATHGEISVMLRPSSRWIPFSDVVAATLNHPIHSRSILPNELVLEIDDNNWEAIRDGTRRIVAQLHKWGAGDSYYLSFSGNRSIHVHVFMDLTSLHIFPQTSQFLAAVEPGAVSSTVKGYITRQFALATDTCIDVQLTGKHLIRMVGGMNEKSGKFCTAIESVPEEKPLYYEIKVPYNLPPKLWDISFMEEEINAYLQIHFRHCDQVHHNGRGKPFSTDGIVSVLRPAYIQGFRHYIVLSLAGWLWRHSIPMETCMHIVRQLNPDDRTPGKTIATVHDVYGTSRGVKVAGYRKLTEIIREEAVQGRISAEIEEHVIAGLRKIARGGEQQ